MTTSLTADDELAPGWVGVRCESAQEAAWLQFAVTAENVSARRRGNILQLPAGPDFRIEKEIKNVVVATAKSSRPTTGTATSPTPSKPWPGMASGSRRPRTRRRPIRPRTKRRWPSCWMEPVPRSACRHTSRTAISDGSASRRPARRTPCGCSARSWPGGCSHVGRRTPSSSRSGRYPTRIRRPASRGRSTRPGTSGRHPRRADSLGDSLPGAGGRSLQGIQPLKSGLPRRPIAAPPRCPLVRILSVAPPTSSSRVCSSGRDLAVRHQAGAILRVGAPTEANYHKSCLFYEFKSVSPGPSGEEPSRRLNPGAGLFQVVEDVVGHAPVSMMGPAQ